MQSSFNFGAKSYNYTESYIVSGSNSAAYKAVLSDNWHNNMLCIVGDAFSGKTHLTQMWAEYTAARHFGASFIDSNIIIDDIAKFSDESQLFHLINNIMASDYKLLVTSSKPLNKISFKLPDLASRISLITQVNIEHPDEDLFISLLTKQMLEQGITLKPNIASYLAKRNNRSYSDIKNLSAQLALLNNTNKGLNLDVVKTLS